MGKDSGNFLFLGGLPRFLLIGSRRFSELAPDIAQGDKRDVMQ